MIFDFLFSRWLIRVREQCGHCDQVIIKQIQAKNKKQLKVFMNPN